MLNCPHRAPSALLLAVLTLVLTAMPAAAQRYLATSDSLHPRLRYADSLDSRNDRCLVAQNKLNPRVRPVYVNGLPMGFC